jgi:hypothetical protein
VSRRQNSLSRETNSSYSTPESPIFLSGWSAGWYAIAGMNLQHREDADVLYSRFGVTQNCATCGPGYHNAVTVTVNVFTTNTRHCHAYQANSIEPSDLDSTGGVHGAPRAVVAGPAGAPRGAPPQDLSTTSARLPDCPASRSIVAGFPTNSQAAFGAQNHGLLTLPPTTDANLSIQACGSP